MQLEAIAAKSKPAPERRHDRLTGRAVELPNDRCKCGSNVAIIDRDRHLNCRSCGRPRGYLSKPTADWIIEVIKTVGAETIAIRGPAL
jgi:DNA-directed RNA polymerase subunit RPC12/RpoP